MSALRACMPALANKSYFNYGGQGPLPTPSLEAIVDTWQRIQELGPFTDDVWPLIGRLSGDLRSRLAAWCGVPPTRVTFTENVTMGCVLPLWGLPWQSGDEILLGDAEHPGVVAACRELAHRLQLTITSLPVLDLSGDGAEADAAVLARLDRSLSPRTRLVVLVLPHLHAIDRQLRQDPAHWEPVFSVAESADGDELADAEDWCIGFLQAVALDADAWEPLFDDAALGPALVPVVVLGAEEAALTPADRERLLDPVQRDALSRAVADAVVALSARPR